MRNRYFTLIIIVVLIFWTVNTKLDNFLKKFASIRNRTQISQ